MEDVKINKGVVITVGVIVLFILWLIFCFRIVGVGEVGIITRFGQINREANSGILIKLPWPIESLTKMNIQTQKDNTQAGAATKDLQQLDTNVNVNYHLTPATAQDVFRKIGPDYVNVVVDPSIQQAIKENTSKYNASELVDNRAVIESAIFKDLSARLAPIGVTVDNVSILDFGFSAEFNKAIESKQVAQQQSQQAQYDLQTAQLKAQAQQVQAATLTPEYLQLKAIEKWSGAMPQYLGTNNVFGIPLSK